MDNKLEKKSLENLSGDQQKIERTKRKSFDNTKKREIYQMPESILKGILTSRKPTHPEISFKDFETNEYIILKSKNIELMNRMQKHLIIKQLNIL